MMDTYWNNNGKFQMAATELEAMVPNSGKCDSLKGELFRAVSKIYYDFHNNGFGNNWVNPALFLMNYVNLDSEVINLLYKYGNGNAHSNSLCDTRNIELLMDTVIQTVCEPLFQDCIDFEDMWEYECIRNGVDRFEYWEDEDDYDYD